LITAEIFPDIAERLRRLGADAAEDHVVMNAMLLARMVAKIGHAFAVAELGANALEKNYVTHLVLDEARDWNYWIGGYDRGRDLPARELHELKFLRRNSELSVIVHLFVPYCPRFAYEVVVGQLRPDVKIPAESEETFGG
jgi:ribonucleotide monophosphatase NagD (HAD superfamily)